MTSIENKVLIGVHALSDEMEYNIYESQDIAEYIKEPEESVEQTIKTLYDNGYLNECMTVDDDGFETFCLSFKAVKEMGL
jgi:predicted ArsR family transcriptional regulator